MRCTLSGIALEAVCSTVARQRAPVTERLSALMPDKKAARLAKGTGVERLSIAEADVCTSDLCCNAAERLFSNGAGCFHGAGRRRAMVLPSCDF